MIREEPRKEGWPKESEAACFFVNPGEPGAPMPELAWGLMDFERCWHANPENREDHELMLGLYGQDGGTHGEVSFRWTPIGRGLVMKVEMFSDATEAMAAAPRLWASILEGGSRWNQKQALVEHLRRAGVIDLTEPERIGPRARFERAWAERKALEEAWQMEQESSSPKARRPRKSKAI